MMNTNKREEQQQQLVVVVVDSLSISSRPSSFEQECPAASTNTTDDDTGILSCRDRQSQQWLGRQQQQQQPHRRHHHHRRRHCPLLLMMMLVLLVLTHGSNKDTSGSSSGGNSFVVVEATKAKAKKKNNSHHQVEFTLPHVPFHTNHNHRDNNNKDGSTPITTTTTTPLIDAQELEHFIEYATSYLVQISHTKTQDPHFPGRFTYQAYTHHNIQPSLQTPQYWNTPHHQQPDYNLLRHNGALYALSQAYTRRMEMERTQKNNNNNKNRSFGVLRSSSSNNGQDNNNNSGRDNNNSNSISSEVILETIQRGIGYLRDNALLRPPGNNGNNDKNNELLLAAWEREDINDPHSTPTTAKLGGAGLALIALGNLHHIDGSKSVSLEKELRPLGAFIESLQNTQDGSFTCKYHWTTGPDDSWQSLYYPGEAALGLVTLAEIESQESIESDTTVDSSSSSSHKKNNKKNQQRWMTVASQTLLYLERYRRDADLDDIEPDHWALLATAKLLPLLHKQRHHLQHKLTTTTNTVQAQLELQQQKQQLDVEYWLIYNHAIKVATSMVTDHTSIQLQRNHGCFSPDMRTCPTATRLEGLLATLTFIQESELYMGDEGHEGTTTELLQDRIEHDVAMGIRFLLNAQQQTNTNQMRGAVPGKYNPTTATNRGSTKNRENSGSGSADASSSEEEEESEEEDNLSNEVRVDYVQHSMSAVIAYEAYLLQKEAKAAAKQRNNNDTFQTKVQEKVHGVTDHLKKQMHRGRNTLTTTTKMSETYANVVLVGILLFFVCIILYIVLVPSYLSTQSSKLKKNF